MKRLIGLCLIICMAVSFCACGKKEDTLKVGDSAATDRAAVMMMEAEFTETGRFSNLEYEIKWNLDNNIIYFNFEFAIKNIGETVLDDKMRNPQGYPYSDQLGAYVELYYADEKYVTLNKYPDYVYDMTTEDEHFNIPVGETHTIFARFTLPRQAMTDGKPIYVNIKLPNSKGEFETFKYTLR